MENVIALPASGANLRKFRKLGTISLRAFDEHLAARFVFIDDEVVEGEGGADNLGEGGDASLVLLER